MEVEGKTIVITGGNGGIGSALAEALRQKRAKVYSLDSNPKASPAEGITYISADLTDSGQVAEAVEQLPAIVDVLVQAVGVMRRGNIFDVSEEDYDLLMNVNLKSCWLTLKHIKPKLVERAMVVQVSSGHALHPEADPGVYTLTKKATANLAEILALTCPKYSVKTVYPGPVLTDLLLTGRNDEDKERISKIAHKPEFLAGEIVKLVESDKQTLRFDHDSFTYFFA